jgi:hypothetical protein
VFSVEWVLNNGVRLIVARDRSPYPDLDTTLQWARSEFPMKRARLQGQPINGYAIRRNADGVELEIWDSRDA